MMRVLKIICFLLFLSAIQAQVKTITLRKAIPYDTPHVTLIFSNDALVMPKFPGGKNGFDVSVSRFYRMIISNGNLKVAASSVAGSKLKDTVGETDEKSDNVFYEGKVLDKAIFVNVKTYCDTDRTIILLPQALPDIYSYAAVKIVRLLPKFIPPIYNEQAVPVYLTIPIRFLREITFIAAKDKIPSKKHKVSHSRLWWFFYHILHPFGIRQKK